MGSTQTPPPLTEGRSGRVWASFGKGNKQQAFYCHGYRQPGEHYHKSYDQLLDCPLLRPAGWQPPVRKVKP